MELTLGRRADYAIRATLALARAPERRHKTRELATAMSIPGGYLPQIMAQLVRSRIVTSVAGPRGGYALARAASAISMLDVIEATEGDPTAGECVMRGGPCRWDDVCAVHVSWTRAQQALLLQLSTTSFAALALLDADLDAGTFVLPPDLARLRPTPEPTTGTSSDEVP
ncbi:Rrf2 family transcriptional regulator [Egicoccus sp. AB-alg6-2]|uniref:RrF2 family transcriptional regulator n=1 Tax=Egicoccus sp. AB-alg6-2 TaxID=3242692 RepID=UPI00359E5C9C